MTGGNRQRRRDWDSLRILVVGAGITGLVAAVRCIQDGHRVVLLERGPIPHPGSTSFDQHRALRLLAVGDPATTRQAVRLDRRWHGLISLLGGMSSAPLYRRVGVLTALHPDLVASAVATADATALPIRIVEAADHPHIGFPPSTAVVLEPRAGVLLADRVLHAATRWLWHHPMADLRPGSDVVGVRPGTGQVMLADGTAESGDVVLVAAGPWSAALMGLPVTLHRQTMVYLRPPAELVHCWAATPIAGGIGIDGHGWLLPSVAGTHLKISTDAARREVATLSDPDDPDGWAARVLSTGIVADVDRYDVVQVRHCHYATAAGGTGFVRVGPATWARLASGGDGFRTAPQAVDEVVGELLSRVASGTGIDLSHPTPRTCIMTGSAPDTLLVIGSGLRLYREYIVRAIAERARKADLRLVLINNLRPTWQLDYFDDITVANVFDHRVLADAAREMAARHRIKGVMCWDEPLVMPAAELAAEFGVPGLGLPGVHGCRDKYTCRARLTAAGLPQPGYTLAADLGQARAAAARIGYPVIVKPRALGASMGVSLASGEQELEHAYQVAHEASLVGDEPYQGGAIVEGFADGPEISIDGAVHRGEYLPMFLARKTTGMPPYFEELRHVVDSSDPLLRDATLLDALATAHRVLGVENGITHTEVRLTLDGPVIIEVNGRLGGDLIPFLGQVATGVEPGNILFDIATGRRPSLTHAHAGVVGIQFGYPGTDCVVRAVVVPEKAAGLVLAARMVDPGTTLRLPPGGYLARHSFVVCSAPDPATCARRLDDAAALVRLDADPVDPPPAGTRLMMPAGLLDVDK